MMAGIQHQNTQGVDMPIGEGYLDIEHGKGKIKAYRGEQEDNSTPVEDGALAQSHVNSPKRVKKLRTESDVHSQREGTRSKTRASKPKATFPNNDAYIHDSDPEHQWDCE
jgi:hypothetical protein